MRNKHIGSSFSSFLDQEDVREEVDLRAKKQILADQILAKMERDGDSDGAGGAGGANADQPRGRQQASRPEGHQLYVRHAGKGFQGTRPESTRVAGTKAQARPIPPL